MQSRMESRAKVNPEHNLNLSFQHYPTWNWKDYLIAESRLHKFTSVKSMDMSRIKLDLLLMSLKQAAEKINLRQRINTQRRKAYKLRQRELKNAKRQKYKARKA